MQDIYKDILQAEQVCAGAPDASSRPPDYAPVLRAVLDRRDVLAVPPIWASRAHCYHELAMLLPGITLVVSPFLVRMQKEIAALESQEIPAVLLHSGLDPYELELRLIRIMRGHFRIVYISPGLLGRPEISPLFRMVSRFSLIVVNEAHVLSVRSSLYREICSSIPAFLADFGEHRPPVLALTIPVTRAVEQEIGRQLQLRRPMLLQSEFLRPNLFYGVYRTQRKEAFLLNFLRRHENESGIVYCFDAVRAMHILQLLRRNGFSALDYHTQLSQTECSEHIRRFCDDAHAQILVAVPDLYLELFRPDIRFILHDAMPQSLERYQLETDRAGWDGRPAECILLSGEDDFDRQKHALQRTEQRSIQTPMVQLHMQEELNVMRRYTRTHRCLRGFLRDYFEREKSGADASALSSADEERKVQEDYVAYEELRLPAHPMPAASPSVLGSVCCTNCNTELFALKEHDGFRVQPRRTVPIIWGREEKSVHTAVVSFPAASASQTQEASAENERSPEMRMQLLQRLRLRRLQLAREQHVPAGCILPDRALLEICRQLPRTQEAFARIYGIGPKKSALYWSECLKEIRRTLEPGAAAELYEAGADDKTPASKHSRGIQKLPFHLTKTEAGSFHCEDGLRSPELARRLNALASASGRNRQQLRGAMIERKLSDLGDLEHCCLRIAGRELHVYLPTGQGEAAGMHRGSRMSRNGTVYPATFYSASAARRIAQLFVEEEAEPL